MREAPGVEHRRRDHRTALGAQRDLRRASRRPAAATRAGCGRRPSACRSCRWSGSRRGPARRAGRGRRCRRARSGPRAVARPRVLVSRRTRRRSACGACRASHQLGELLVVDDGLGLLALADVGDLRAREHRVEVQRVGAELRARHGRVDEAAMVAAEDRDAVALADAEVAPRVGQRVGAGVDLLEGQRPQLVDDRRACRDGVRRRPRSRPPASGPSAPWSSPCGRACRAAWDGSRRPRRGP